MPVAEGSSTLIELSRGDFYDKIAARRTAPASAAQAENLNQFVSSRKPLHGFDAPWVNYVKTRDRRVLRFGIVPTSTKTKTVPPMSKHNQSNVIPLFPDQEEESQVSGWDPYIFEMVANENRGFREDRRRAPRPLNAARRRALILAARRKS